jgi:hypothetical protein
MQTITTDRTSVSVFVSYSWDNEDHKAWALEFAKRLREDGIDAIIDQTHLKLGARSPEFMERSVRESQFVLVVCTEPYKRKFDERTGGAGYEGHIITGEIVNEVGKDKFIPVLKHGRWETALPTALSGVHGVDLRTDAPEEYQRLIKRLHGIADVSKVGPRPSWLPPSSSLSIKAVSLETDDHKYVEQRRKLPETKLTSDIRSRPHWRIWIRPTQFKTARFQNTEQCKGFVISSEVRIGSWFPYPGFFPNTLEIEQEWIAGEIDRSDGRITRQERWALFRSAQFVQSRGLDAIPQLAGRVHVLEILDTATAVFEFAARMAEAVVVSPEWIISCELHRIDGRELTWPQDLFCDIDAVGQRCWSQDEVLATSKVVAVEELKPKRRELALTVALEIYSKFGWTDPPRQRLLEEQNKRSGC